MLRRKRKYEEQAEYRYIRGKKYKIVTVKQPVYNAIYANTSRIMKYMIALAYLLFERDPSGVADELRRAKHSLLHANKNSTLQITTARGRALSIAIRD